MEALLLSSVSGLKSGSFYLLPGRVVKIKNLKGGCLFSAAEGVASPLVKRVKPASRDLWSSILVKQSGRSETFGEAKRRKRMEKKLKME